MTTGLMRRFSSSALSQLPRSPRTSSLPQLPYLAQSQLPYLAQSQRHLTVARPRHAAITSHHTRFTTSSPRALEPSDPDQKRTHDRNLKLGTTIRILHDSLPNLLNSPLPSHILSPTITLHLFPSTHPHLPTVRGRLAYTAALWTAPVAWGRVPVIGNVKLDILSERMIKHTSSPSSSLPNNEKLIVKWQTCPKTDSSSKHVSEAFQSVTNIVRQGRDEEFTGLFLFEFDEEGRVVKHTIEHVDEGCEGEKTGRFVSVTEWLLGGRWRGEAGLAFEGGEGRGFEK